MAKSNEKACVACKEDFRPLMGDEVFCDPCIEAAWKYLEIIQDQKKGGIDESLDMECCQRIFRLAYGEESDTRIEKVESSLLDDSNVMEQYKKQIRSRSWKEARGFFGGLFGGGLF